MIPRTSFAKLLFCSACSLLSWSRASADEPRVILDIPQVVGDSEIDLLEITQRITAELRVSGFRVERVTRDNPDMNQARLLRRLTEREAYAVATLSQQETLTVLKRTTQGSIHAEPISLRGDSPRIVAFRVVERIRTGYRDSRDPPREPTKKAPTAPPVPINTPASRWQLGVHARAALIAPLRGAGFGIGPGLACSLRSPRGLLVGLDGAGPLLRSTVVERPTQENPPSDVSTGDNSATGNSTAELLLATAQAYLGWHVPLLDAALHIEPYAGFGALFLRGKGRPIPPALGTDARAWSPSAVLGLTIGWMVNSHWGLDVDLQNAIALQPIRVQVGETRATVGLPLIRASLGMRFVR